MIGYASKTEGLYEASFKTYSLKTMEDRALDVIDHNLKSLDRIIDYNIENKIGLFRISSDIIPLASRPEMTLNWQAIFKSRLEELGQKISRAELRVSMHPGQYTVLNSKDEEVVKRAIRDLDYHAEFLELLARDKSSKIILHIGGVYGDKASALARFEKNYKGLDRKVKDRLVIENDDRSYSIEDVLDLGLRNSIPVVYDKLHADILKPKNPKSHRQYIMEAASSWSPADGRQKIHYSQQDESKRTGSHSRTIDAGEFLDFYRQLDGLDLDIMLEVKDKNLSALKIKNLLDRSHIKYLEKEWSIYKYSVLERSNRIYNEIRALLRDKEAYPVLEFYRLIDQAMALEVSRGGAINGLDHVWGYFKSRASQEERQKYGNYLKSYGREAIGLAPIKKYLYRLALKYEMDYLLKTIYFDQ